MLGRGWEEGLWILGVSPCALLCAANHRAKHKTMELLDASFYFGLAITDLRASWNHSGWASAVAYISQLLWCDGSLVTSRPIVITISPRTVLLLFS